MNFQEILTKIGFSITFDTAIIGFLVLAAFFYGLSAGKKRVILLLISTYVGYALLFATPNFNQFGLQLLPYTLLRIALFILYTVVVFWIFSKASFGDLFPFSKMRGIKHWWQIFLLSVLQVGLWVSIVLTLFPEQINLKIAPITELVFTKHNGLFLWLVLPILFLGLIRRRKKDTNVRVDVE